MRYPSRRQQLAQGARLPGRGREGVAGSVPVVAAAVVATVDSCLGPPGRQAEAARLAQWRSSRPRSSRR